MKAAQIVILLTLGVLLGTCAEGNAETVPLIYNNTVMVSGPAALSVDGLSQYLDNGEANCYGKDTGTMMELYVQDVSTKKNYTVCVKRKVKADKITNFILNTDGPKFDRRLNDGICICNALKDQKESMCIIKKLLLIEGGPYLPFAFILNGYGIPVKGKVRVVCVKSEWEE